MIVRIVLLPLQDEKANDFLKLFDEIKITISNFKGCKHLDLLNDVNDRRNYFTYSVWETEKDLNNYRQSEFFSQTWKLAKACLREKATAWSLEKK